MKEKISAYDLSELGVAVHVRGHLSYLPRPSYAYVRGSAQWYEILHDSTRCYGWLPATREEVRHDIAWRCRNLARRVAEDDTLTHRFGDAVVLRLGSLAMVDTVEQALMILSDFANEQHLADKTLQRVVEPPGAAAVPYDADGEEVDLKERHTRRHSSLAMLLGMPTGSRE